MSKPEDKCVTPAKGPISAPVRQTPSAAPGGQVEEDGHAMTPMVGRKAPDFEASAYVDGGFRNIKLSDYSGKWVMLCFYPGDFTFV